MSYKNLLFIFKVFLKQVSHLEKTKLWSVYSVF